MGLILKENHYQMPALQTVFFSTMDSNRQLLSMHHNAPLNILFTEALLIEGGVHLHEIMKKQKPTLLHIYSFTYTLSFQFLRYILLTALQ